MLLFSSFGKTFLDALVKNFTGVLFVVFVVLAVGYILGRINVKGVSFGSSAVFIVAIVTGVVLYKVSDKLNYDGKPAFAFALEKNGGSTVKAIKDIGLALFVTAIGFTAGPTFIRNFKKKALSYVTVGVTVVVIGTALCIGIILMDKNLSPAEGAGILMGSLTSTPGLTSAQEVFGEGLKGTVAAASGLAYPFGVLGVVLFVQLMPKILRRDMAVEVQKLKAAVDSNVKIVDEAVVTMAGDTVTPPSRKKFVLDGLGFAVFSLAVALGMILGSLTFEMTSSAKFALGTTGGCLIVALVFGHFGRIGNVSLEVPKATISVLKELGLVLFLAASGIEGGLMFLKVFKWVMLLYGVILTVVPMVAAYLIARFLFKLELLNNLGAVCGGMTSTPALGALIHVSKTDDVAQSYAATYPIALFLLVFAPQIINLIC